MTKALALAFALVLLIPASAVVAKPPKKAVVKEGVGVAGVSLGMTDKQAVAKWGKPEGGKCSQTPGTKFGNCSWNVDPKQTVNLLTISHKIVNIGMLGTLWRTKKATPGKTTFEQLAKLYPGIKIGYTCALDFGHVAILKKGKHVTVFATSNNTPPTAAFGQINILDFSKTGYAQVQPGTGLETRTECDPKNRTQQPIGGDGGGGTPNPSPTTTRPTYTVAGKTAGDGDGDIIATSTASDAGCNGSFCVVYGGSPVTLTAKPGAGSHFVGWSGDCSGTDLSFTFADVEADHQCNGEFALDTP